MSLIYATNFGCVSMQEANNRHIILCTFEFLKATEGLHFQSLAKALNINALNINARNH